MADFEWAGRPERTSLRRALRHRLRLDLPDLRVVAEEFLTESSAIDLLAVGLTGELVSIRLGEDEAEDKALLTCALADLDWLHRRAADFIKLAPGLGIAPDRAHRAMLVCPRFSPEALSAIGVLRPGQIELMRYRCLRQRGQLALLTEAVDPGDAASRARRSAATPGPPARARHPEVASTPRLTDPPSASTFRTGLSDAELAAPSKS